MKYYLLLIFAALLIYYAHLSEITTDYLTYFLSLFGGFLLFFFAIHKL